MTIHHVIAIFAVSVVSAATAGSQQLAAPGLSSPPAVLFPVHDSEYREITSQITGKTYALLVWLPPGYQDSDDAYPVVYIVDGQPYVPY